VLPGCTGGAAFGASTSGLLGNASSATTSRVGGTIGAGFGVLLGGHAGVALDDEDEKRADVADLQALETSPSGAPVAWRNPDTGRYGNVVPGPFYLENGVAAVNTRTPCTSTAPRRLSTAPRAGSPRRDVGDRGLIEQNSPARGRRPEPASRLRASGVTPS